MSCRMCEVLEESIDLLHEENKTLRKRLALVTAHRNVQDRRNKSLRDKNDAYFQAMCEDFSADEDDDLVADCPTVILNH